MKAYASTQRMLGLSNEEIFNYTGSSDRTTNYLLHNGFDYFRGPVKSMRMFGSLMIVENYYPGASFLIKNVFISYRRNI
jgi:hypothetical protein